MKKIKRGNYLVYYCKKGSVMFRGKRIVMSNGEISEEELKEILNDLKKL